VLSDRAAPVFPSSTEPETPIVRPEHIDELRRFQPATLDAAATFDRARNFRGGQGHVANRVEGVYAYVNRQWGLGNQDFRLEVPVFARLPTYEVS
jgi:hypothetical protein